jgi:hypothetical protein
MTKTKAGSFHASTSSGPRRLRRGCLPPKTAHSESCEIRSAIEIAGFPFGIKRDPSSLLPIVISGEIAGHEIQTPFVSVYERVHLCTPTIAEGTSGGPVYIRRRSTKASDEIWELFGVFVGLLADSSGPKLGKIAPIRGILDALEDAPSTD